MPAKPAAPKKVSKPKMPKPKKSWIAFLQAHPTPYTAIFAKETPIKGTTLTKAVRGLLKTLAAGRWETLTFTDRGATVVWVAFADQADFDTAKKHFNGQPWRSNVIGAVDGFQYTLP